MQLQAILCGSRTAIAAMALSLVLTGCSTYGPVGDRALAGAELKDAQGASRGTAALIQTSQGTVLSLEVTGLKPGARHGLHIHTLGKCEAPGFTTAGGHWNPTARQHGKDNPAGPHSGDLPNLTIAANGRGSLRSVIQTTDAAQPAPLLDADGAAVIIHAAADDMKTDPSGNSGDRIICGVFVPRRPG